MEEIIKELKENFDERLFKLEVDGVDKDEVPLIVNPKTGETKGTVVCYRPTFFQTIQLALMVFQVEARDRLALALAHKKRTPKYKVAENHCMECFSVLTHLFLPYVKGDLKRAGILCQEVVKETKSIVDKYIDGWKAVSRPPSVWLNKESKTLFLCKNENRIMVGLNRINDLVFIYDHK